MRSDYKRRADSDYSEPAFFFISHEGVVALPWGSVRVIGDK